MDYIIIIILSVGMAAQQSRNYEQKISHNGGSNRGIIITAVTHRQRSTAGGDINIGREVATYHRPQQRRLPDAVLAEMAACSGPIVIHCCKCRSSIFGFGP